MNYQQKLEAMASAHQRHAALAHQLAKDAIGDVDNPARLTNATICQEYQAQFHADARAVLERLLNVE